MAVDRTVILKAQFAEDHAIYHNIAENLFHQVKELQQRFTDQGQAD